MALKISEEARVWQMPMNLTVASIDRSSSQ